MNGVSMIWRDCVQALGFLSRLPLPARYFENDHGNIARISRFFPLAGALIALLPAAFLGGLLLSGTKPELAALVALLVQILLTGALHEDGLADCADGFWGGRDKDRVLEIMKDSRLGAYGGLALLLSVLLRMEALAGIADSLGAVAASAALPAVNALSRAAMVRHWTALPPAKTVGVAAAAGQPETPDCNAAWLLGLGIYAVVAIAGLGLAPAFWGLLVAFASTLGFIRLTRGKIGGHTGDTLGAAEQITQTAMLVVLAIIG